MASLGFVARSCCRPPALQRFGVGASSRFTAATTHCQYSTTPDGDHPLIDVSPLLPGRESHPKRAEVISNIGAALRSAGYFYAQNVDALPAEYLASVYEYSRRVHALPSEVKRRYSGATGQQTYTGPDVGQVELAYEPGVVSTVRAWDYSRTRFTLATSSAHGEHEKERDLCYPGADIIAPPYADFLDDLYERQNILARSLMIAFAEALGLKSETLLDMFRGGESEGDFGTIRLLSYPGSPQLSLAEAKTATAGISPHTDFEVFTLMHQDAPGMQFIRADELIAAEKHGQPPRWTDAPVRPGEFVVIMGDVMERLTNGFLRATPHRVIVTPHARSSIIRFNAFAANTVVAPLPAFVTESQPAKYSWVTMETHMETTMRNLEAGLGSWDPVRHRSLTANYCYIDGVDHQKAEASR